MKTHAFAGFAIVMAISAPAAAADLATARAFLIQAYAHYPASESGFDALGAAARTLFDPSLIGLIKEDERLANGEVGALDGDPLCDCQDDGGMTFHIARVRSSGPGRAKAVVIRMSPGDTPEREDISLDLVVVKGAWRVWDVETKDTPSLRAMLIKSNREAVRRAGH